MMEHQVRGKANAHRRRRRVGRGNASGRGTYAGKGLKGQKARSGKGPRPGFEGGQLPLIKRLPEKRGFTNIFKKEYALVKVGALEAHSGEGPVTLETLVQMRLLRNLKLPVKVLGDGELTKPLTVSAHKFSSSARSKIEGVGGKVEEVQP
jgi:large subunit ribosomal protein L15